MEPKYLYSHIRNQHGKIIATLAMNRSRQIGGVFLNPKDKFNLEHALKISAVRADNNVQLNIPDTWVTPHLFVRKKRNSSLPLTDLLALKLDFIVYERIIKLMYRADKVWGEVK